MTKYMLYNMVDEHFHNCIRGPDRGVSKASDLVMAPNPTPLYLCDLYKMTIRVKGKVGMQSFFSNT